MRKIELNSWKENGEDYGLFQLVNVVTSLAQQAKDMPQGMEHFKIFSRINKAFEDVKGNVLELEEAEYNFIKDLLEKYVPAQWGMNKDIMKAVNAFMDAKEE